MTLFRAALPFCLAAALAAAAETVPADLLPPGTKILIGVDLRSVIDSPFFLTLDGVETGKLAATFTNAAPLAGVDPLKDLDGVILAVTGHGENVPGLLIIRGRFHPDRTDGARIYRGVPIFEDKHSAKGSLALLDAATAVAGARGDVEAAIDRRGQPSTLPPAVAARLEALAARGEFWGFGDVPEGFYSAHTAEKSSDTVDHFEFSASLSNGLALDAEVHVRSLQGASKMAMSLKTLEAMLAAQQPSSAGTRFDLRTENGNLKVALFIPEAELRKGIAQQKEVLAGMLQSQLGAAPPPRQSAAPVPKLPATTIVTNDRGETVSVTLPGAK